MSIWLEARLYVKEEKTFYWLRREIDFPLLPVGTRILWDCGRVDWFDVLKYEVLPREILVVIAVLGTDRDIVVDEGDQPVRVTPVDRDTVDLFLDENWEVHWDIQCEELCPEAEELMMRAMGNWRSDPVHDAWQKVYEIEPSYREHRGLADADAGPAA